MKKLTRTFVTIFVVVLFAGALNAQQTKETESSVFTTQAYLANPGRMTVGQILDRLSQDKDHRFEYTIDPNTDANELLSRTIEGSYKQRTLGDLLVEILVETARAQFEFVDNNTIRISSRAFRAPTTNLRADAAPPSEDTARIVAGPASVRRPGAQVVTSVSGDNDPRPIVRLPDIDRLNSKYYTDHHYVPGIGYAYTSVGLGDRFGGQPHYNRGAYGYPYDMWGNDPCIFWNTVRCQREQRNFDGEGRVAHFQIHSTGGIDPEDVSVYAVWEDETGNKDVGYLNIGNKIDNRWDGSVPLKPGEKVSIVFQTTIGGHQTCFSRPLLPASIAAHDVANRGHREAPPKIGVGKKQFILKEKDGDKMLSGTFDPATSTCDNTAVILKKKANGN